jgi:hypothetical protein
MYCIYLPFTQMELNCLAPDRAGLIFRVIVLMAGGRPARNNSTTTWFAGRNTGASYVVWIRSDCVTDEKCVTPWELALLRWETPIEVADANWGRSDDLNARRG